MHPKPSPLCKLSALTLGLALAAPAMAQKITTTAVTDITFTGPPAVVEVLLKDQSGGNAVAQVNVQPVTTSLSIPVTSTVKCAKSQWGYSHSKVGFGAFNPTFLDAGVVHQEENPQAGSTTWTGLKWITEAAAQHMYQVSLNELKNPGKPERQLDVLAEFNAAMNTFIQQGGTQLDFLKEDRTIDVQRHISVLGACWTGVSSKGFATYTKPLTVRIKYQGNPQLSGVNIQLGNMGSGQIQAGYQPMQLSSGQILPHAPNYMGACPADLKFRVVFNGVGNGELRYRINEGGGAVYNSPALPFVDGKLQHDFIIPVAFEGKHTLGKKVDHNYTLHARFKDEKGDVWPVAFQPFGAKNWSHTCTPQLAVGTGGMGGIQQAPGNTPEPSDPMRIKTQPTPPPKPGTLVLPGATPSQPLVIQRQPPAPPPAQPKRIAAPQ